MAFLDLLKVPSKVTLYDVKDRITLAKSLANNPNDIITTIRNKVQHEVMAWDLSGKQKAKYKLPLKYEIADFRGLSIDKAEKSFSVKLESFKKVSTQGGSKGKSESVRNIQYGAGILPQPQNIIVSYPKNWAGEAGGSALTSAYNGEYMESAKRVGAQLYNSAAGSSRVGVDTKKALGKNTNDRIKTLFKDIPFRTFELSFMLQPKEQKDIGLMTKFIKEMKLASAPNIGDGGASWLFPDTFKMTYTGGNGNILFKTLELACTNISVNYTPQGVWAQFKDGNPVAIQVTLSFMEMEYATRSAITKDLL